MAWGGFFGRRSFLDPEDEAWHLEMWRWMLRNFGGLDDLKAAPLVKPTASFFPGTNATGHARAEHIFGIVKALARIPDWPCELVAQPEGPDLKVGELAVLKMRRNTQPLGTFSSRGPTVTITYNPKTLTNPAELIATLAHELAHYMIATREEETPGGHDMHEYATDLMTVFMGFGAMCANRAFNFSQHHDFQTQGWQMSTAGYLNERDWVFALAVFLALRQETPAVLRDVLKPHLYADLGKATRYVARNASLLPS